MKNHTKTQRHALELLRARLDPTHPLFSASPQVAIALGSSNAAGLYMRSWVLPLVDYLLNGEAYYGEAEAINREHASRIVHAAEAKRLTNIFEDFSTYPTTNPEHQP